MKTFSIFLVEPGLPAEPPVFPRDSVSCTYPFWGDYCLLDFAAANLRQLSSAEWRCLAEPRFRSLGDNLTVRFGPEKIPVLTMEQGLRSLLPVLEQETSELVLLYPFPHVCIIDQDSLAAKLEQPGADIVRLSVDNTPLDLYITRRKALARLIKEALAGSAELHTPLGCLFSRVLEGRFEIIENLPGMTLFQNSLMQLYQSNRWLAEHLGTSRLQEHIARLNNGRAPDGEIRIEKGAAVKDSFLSTNTVVEGRVDSSVLFPGVVVRRGAVVQDSVVMSNNWIGVKAQIYRSLILAHSSDSAKGQANIGEESFIGMKQSAVANAQYPSQVRDGLTVLGANAEIPRGCTIGPGCLLGAGVSAEQLRKYKELRKGVTLLCATSQ
jgi:carbonic anhydrase/acetyltransferase-like protein (isoleucine patch superfamily)